MSLVSPEEIQLINNDSKYRSYVTAVEKSLKNFESSTEWADLISSLGKLKKVLQSFPKYAYIPKRVSVCKRLAQCLHPALPSGVHLKALEVYIVAFQNMGPELLAKDISLYSSGLFPLLANAALSVKPVLLSVYETYFLPLKKSLRPCLTGLIIALLPGLEEGSDFYARTFTLLKNICAAQSDLASSTQPLSVFIADDKYFYTCLWSAVISQSSIRFPAIQFILTNFENKNKFSSNSETGLNPANTPKAGFKKDEHIEDQLYLIGNSIDLMINAICCCLQDMNPLVQRSVLDLMCLCLPLNSQQITRTDKINLIVVAIHVILRRDMSLNRRIYAWFMGSSSTAASTPGAAVPPSSASAPTTAAAPAATNGVKTPSGDMDDLNIEKSATCSEENFFNSNTKALLVTAIKALLNSRRDSSLVQYLIIDESATLGANNTFTVTNTTTSQIPTTSTQTTTTLKLLKIVSNLVERQEIGQAIIDDILLDLLNYVYRECSSLAAISTQSASTMAHLKSRPVTALMTSSPFSSSTQASILQYTKELNEIKKATCNFLFQSFQLYFIWEFCARKFETICANYTSSVTDKPNPAEASSPSNELDFSMMNASPAHICDLYEFILDLLTNSDVYNEIQTEYLPLMLKRIILTINTYCPKMTNNDLSKSFLLCIKILNKMTITSKSRSTSNESLAESRVVPKIIFPETSAGVTQSTVSNKQANNKSSESVAGSKSNECSSSGSIMLKKLSSNDSDSGKIESIVAHLLDEMIETIELESLDPEDPLTPNTVGTMINSNSQQYLIDACLASLKQLCHTFARSHLFQPGEAKTQEDIDKSFASLFYSSAESRLPQIQIPDEAALGVYVVKMKTECLSYLHSFQILNKLLIKILFFPRESAVGVSPGVGGCSGGDSDQDRLVSEFEDWVKDLFVVSCSSFISGPNNVNSTYALFEYQSITLNTIIELIHLSESVNSHFGGESTAAQSSSQSNQASSVCLLQTIFSQAQIDLIFHNSKFGLITANMLWSHLNQQEMSSSATVASHSASSSIDKRAAILFCLLHELLPTNLCEDIISSQLLAVDMGVETSESLTAGRDSDLYLTSSLPARLDSFKRFVRLWHWSRELVSHADSDLSGRLESVDDKSNDISVSTLKYAKMKKTFERSLMIVLNMLTNKDTPVTLTKLIKEWLLSSICDYNDLPRILDVLLVSLLHPSTARVSIQHFITKILTSTPPNNQLGTSPNKSINFYLTSANDDADSENIDQIRSYESKVYAISNEGGQVKYHVSGGQAASSATTPAKTPTDANKLLLMTQGDQASAVVKPHKNLNVELPLSILNAASLGASGISLRINPFMVAKNGSVPALDLGDSLASEDFTDSTCNEDESARNARLLENYKAIKVGQLQKEKEKMLNAQKALSTSNSSIPASISPKHSKESTMTTPQKDSSMNDSTSDHHTTNNETVSFDGAVMVAGCSDDEDDDPYEDDLDENEGIVDEDDEDEDEIYSDIYNGGSVGASGGVGHDDSDEPKANNSGQSGELAMMGGEEFYGSYNGGGGEDELDEDSASHNTEITLLGVSSSQTNLDKPPGASPSLLKKFSKISRLPKKISANAVTSTEKKIAKLSANKSLVLGSSDGITISNSKYFKKFKFKRSKGDETGKKDKSDKLSNLEKTKSKSTSQSLSVVAPSSNGHLQAQNFQQSRPTVLSSSPRQRSSTAGAATSSLSHSRDLVVDASNPIDLNYAHMLIYINCNNIRIHSLSHTSTSSKLVVATSFSNAAYDHVRTMFVLRSIEQLLLECDREFLSAVIATSVTANPSVVAGLGSRPRTPVFSVHNEKFLDLISRHLRTIYGASFYSQANQPAASPQSQPTAASNPPPTNTYSPFNLNNTTYMEAMTFILLFYIRSYYPPSRFTIKLTNTNVNLNTPHHQTSNNSTMSKSNSVSTTSLHSSTTTTTQTSTSSLLASAPLSHPYQHATHHSSTYDEDLFAENRNIQIYALKLLGRLIRDLVDLCKSNNSKLANSSGGLVQWYQALIELMDKCKLAKTLLHCFYSTVCAPGHATLAQCVLNAAGGPSKRQIECSYLAEMMITLENLIELERILADYQTIVRYYKSPGMSARTMQQSNSDPQSAQDDDLMLTFAPIKKSQSLSGIGQTTTTTTTNGQLATTNSSSSTRYIPQQTIPNQSMFISSILHYLKSISLVDNHIPVLKLVKNALPSCGMSLKSISTFIIEQLCRNLLYITSGGLSSTTMGSSSGHSSTLPLISYMSAMSSLINIPDFVITMLRELTFMLQHCLISTTGVLANSASLSLLMSLSEAVGSGAQQTDVQFRLFRQFQADSELSQAQARECLVQLLPSVLSTMAQVWQRCNLLLASYGLFGVNVLFEQHVQGAYSWVLGHPVVIKQCITDMLNQVAQWNAGHFIVAVGSVWGEKRRKSRLYLEHRVIIELVRSLRALPVASILQTIAEVIKQSGSTTPGVTNTKDKKKTPLNIWLLQFAHSYLESYMTSTSTAGKQAPKSITNQSLTQATSSPNSDLAPSLSTFLKDCLSSVSATSPYATACYFQLFRILHDAVNAVPALVDDKRFVKDIQEVTHKLFELCNSIVASSLQQTTWLRKNYAVRLNTSLPQSASSNTVNLTSSGSNSVAATGSASNTASSIGTASSASVTAVGAGPGVGGAMLIHNDSSHSLPISSVSSSQQTINSSTTVTSGYAGSSGMGSTTGSVSGASVATTVTASGVASTATAGNPAASTPKSSNENYSTFSDLDNDAATNLNSIDSLNGVGDINDSNNNLIHSLHALNILAEYLAKTLDIVYKSEEKDRLVVPLLVNLMSNLWPYLKTHSVANRNNFRAASHLLMSLTVYPYTRKTWKKEVFEMLFESLFFHVDGPTLEYLKAIIDNLISNDRVMFKDVLTRVTYQQSGGLFSSKEQESESKAQLLKRLAFVIYSSEKDQYQKNMPEIQECIAHVLKLTQSANLYSTLLLLFRILILRISSRHLIALWPTIISELIMVLLQIEQDLSDDLETKNSKTTYLDHIAITANSYQHSSAAKLQIYLSACKLIDLILTLPNSLTPQFQLYKWSFINTEDALNLKQKDQFVPYLTKISSLLKLKYPNNKTSSVKFANGPLIRQRQLTGVVDLKPFFDTVTTHAFVHNSSQSNLINNHQYQQTQNLLTSTNLRMFEAAVHEDFLEGWTQT